MKFSRAPKHPYLWVTSILASYVLLDLWFVPLGHRGGSGPRASVPCSFLSQQQVRKLAFGPLYCLKRPQSLELPGGGRIDFPATALPLLSLHLITYSFEKSDRGAFRGTQAL